MTLVLSIAWAGLAHPAATLGQDAAEPGAESSSPVCTAEVEPNDLPEQAPSLTGEACLAGTLVEVLDQDLFFWEVAPEDGLTTWSFTVRGVPTTITSAHVFSLPDPIVFPLVGLGEAFRADSDAHVGTPPVTTATRLAPGRYLVGISRGEAGFNQLITDDRDYELRIARTGTLPPAGDVEPNDDSSTATPVAGAFELSGDLAGSVDAFRWTLSEEDAGRMWRLEALSSMGAYLRVALATEGTEVLASGEADPDGSAAIHDLRLPAGEYVITLGNAAEQAQPYALRAVAVTDPDIDPEPNDSQARAMPLDPSTLTARGRLAHTYDVDRYLLDVDAGLAGRLLDVTLIWSDGSYKMLCILSEDGTRIGCPEGEGSVAISALVLPGGRYLIDVSGTAGLDDRYELRVTPGAAAAADREAEPNDLPATATTWDPMVIMHGSASGDEIDWYRVHVDGGPALWQLDASGTGISSIAWLRPDLIPMGSVGLAPDGSRAEIDDLYLVPGDHTLSIQAAGAYELTLIEQGPPVAGAELEPNDDPSHAEALSVGSARVGRLPTTGDLDLYGFTLTAPAHVIVRLEPPADGDIEMTLAMGLEPIRLHSGAPGEVVVEDLALVPGDYLLQLSPRTPSRGTYSLTLEWADPFAFADDQEPNDGPNDARPLPASLEVHGTAKGPSDEDWYEVPALEAPGTLRIHVESETTPGLALSDGNQIYDLALQADQATWAAEALPAGVPLFLDVTTSSDYRLTVSGDGLIPGPDPVGPSFELSLSPSAGSVAAYWPESQRLEGSLSIASTAASSLDLSLDAVTSQWGWTARPRSDRVSVPAGGTISVPVTVDVPPDAWSREPVRVTVRARDESGGQHTAYLDVTLDPDAAPVAPGSIWTVPDALLGGLNVASLALGAAPGGTIDLETEKLLYDEVTPDYGGFSMDRGVLPADIDVDLAGEAPIPIAGTIVHPHADVITMRDFPRDFDLLLSVDGATWEVALSGKLQPLPVDQAFVLPAPVDARFARLRVRSMYGPTSSGLKLAEWKVVAAPGWATSATPLDIADPVLGGHIRWMSPIPGDGGARLRMLDDDPTREVIHPGATEEATFLIAFHDDRAAQVTELGWIDPAGSDPAVRLASVGVELSVDGPLGPWRSLGTWSLERAEDGSVAPFPLPPGTWARWVRLTGAIPPAAVEQSSLELPGSLRVLERATDAEYRSILGEWGDARPVGPYEWLAAPAVDAPASHEDAGDTAETASPLAAGHTARDEAHFEVDEDWYALTVPADQNTLSIAVRAQPAVAVELSLFDRGGREVPINLAPGDPFSAHWIALVQPGESYRLRVLQPPLSAVVTFDSSGSIGHWTPRIARALRAFTDDMEPGREAVMIVPFEAEPLLEEWSDQPDALREAVDGFPHGIGGSSAGGIALLDATTLLADRTGAHAILIMTDAEDETFHRSLDLLGALGRVRPIIFSVLVSIVDPPFTRDLMQDWAGVNGGFYQYATTQADMDQAFARMAAWLRRPASYELSYAASNVDYPPSTLSVVPAEGASVPVGGGVSLELVLDTSGSMNKKIAGVTRMALARETLTRLVDETLPEGLPVALRTFKAGDGSCKTVLAVPFEPLERAAMDRVIAELPLHRKTRTPLGATLHAVGDDLAGRPGPKLVVFVTDGKETCKGDPAAEVERLVDLGVDVALNIVGFALEDPALKADMETWAAAGGGTFFDAQDQESLLAGITAALQAPYRIFDDAGTLVGSGIVGGPGIELPVGRYRVEVLTDPLITFEDVALGNAVELLVGGEEEGSARQGDPYDLVRDTSG